MVTSTTDPHPRCRVCKMEVSSDGENRLVYACHDLICQKCDEVAKANLGSRPDQQMESLRCSFPGCSNPMEDTTGAAAHLISLMDRIKALEEVNKALRLSQRPCVASSSAASSSRDTYSDYSSSIYDAVKPTSASLRPDEKAVNFISDDNGEMNLHGLSEADLNQLFDSKKGLFIRLLKKLHIIINEYFTNKVKLPFKYNFKGESYNKYLAAVRLAANPKAAECGIGLACFYQVYASELGLNSFAQQNIIEQYGKISHFPDVQYNVFSRIAYLMCKNYISKIGQSNRARREDTDFKAIIPYVEAAKAKSSENLSIPSSPYPRIDSNLLLRLECFTEYVKKRPCNFDGLERLIDNGDVDALCMMAELLQDRKLSEIIPQTNIFTLKERFTTKILTKLTEYANEKHPKACALLGLYYYEGSHGLERNLKQAETCFRFGCNNGSPLCAYWLAQLLKSDISEYEAVIILFEIAQSGGINCTAEVREFAQEGKIGRPNISRPNESYFMI